MFFVRVVDGVGYRYNICLERHLITSQKGFFQALVFLEAFSCRNALYIAQNQTQKKHASSFGGNLGVVTQFFKALRTNF